MVKRIKKVAKPNAAQEIGKPHHIVFGFRYLHPTSYPDCNNSAFFIKFLKRLQQLSTITWEQANVADRHSFGYEKIPVEQIKPHVNLTEDVRTIVAFRATGDNHVFLGLREADVFQVVFIESSFGDIYNH